MKLLIKQEHVSWISEHFRLLLNSRMGEEIAGLAKDLLELTRITEQPLKVLFADSRKQPCNALSKVRLVGIPNTFIKP